MKNPTASEEIRRLFSGWPWLVLTAFIITMSDFFLVPLLLGVPPSAELIVYPLMLSRIGNLLEMILDPYVWASAVVSGLYIARIHATERSTESSAPTFITLYLPVALFCGGFVFLGSLGTGLTKAFTTFHNDSHQVFNLGELIQWAFQFSIADLITIGFGVPLFQLAFIALNSTKRRLAAIIVLPALAFTAFKILSFNLVMRMIIWAYAWHDISLFIPEEPMGGLLYYQSILQVAVFTLLAVYVQSKFRRRNLEIIDGSDLRP